jgi:hypothetical protein
MDKGKEIQKQLESLNSLRNKLNKDLTIEKEKTADFFKTLKKDDLFKQPTKMTLWQRIKKVLNF